MMGIEGVKGWLNQQKTNMSEAMTRVKNKDFMNAVVAGCALVAAADGDISAAEKQKMAGFIQRTDELKVFDMNAVIQAFNKYAEGFDFDHTIGKGEALKAIGKIKKNPDDARLLVRVCCAIGMADGDFDDDEKGMIRDICNELSLNVADFGL